MPEIIVTTRLSHGRDRTVLHQERVCARDLESEHFAAQLVERLGWALTDADEAERPDGDEVDDATARGDATELERRAPQSLERTEPQPSG